MNPFGNKNVCVTGRAIYTGDSQLPERIEVLTIEERAHVNAAIDIRGSLRHDTSHRTRTTTLIASSSDKHFLHSSVVLRHANGESGEAEHHIETILTEAAVHKRRVWVSSVLFAELRPSTFVPGRFATLFELTRYIRALATLVTPDPNAMLRVARLRDAKWHMASRRP